MGASALKSGALSPSHTFARTRTIPVVWDGAKQCNFERSIRSQSTSMFPNTHPTKGVTKLVPSTVTGVPPVDHPLDGITLKAVGVASTSSVRKVLLKSRPLSATSTVTFPTPRGPGLHKICETDLQVAPVKARPPNRHTICSEFWNS